MPGGWIACSLSEPPRLKVSMVHDLKAGGLKPGGKGDAIEAIIQVLESMLEFRDPYTVGHQRRVSQIACDIGREMGLSEERLRDLRMAGTLHDLGKIAIPVGLLSKPGNLTHLEFALIKTHPEVAYNILEPISLPGKTAEIILQHHERLDGSGYPQGLRGDDILLDARILGVADVMEAMSSHRPYRASWAWQKPWMNSPGTEGFSTLHPSWKLA